MLVSVDEADAVLMDRWTILLDAQEASGAENSVADLEPPKVRVPGEDVVALGPCGGPLPIMEGKPRLRAVTAEWAQGWLAESCWHLVPRCLPWVLAVTKQGSHHTEAAATGVQLGGDGSLDPAWEGGGTWRADGRTLLVPRSCR